MKGTYSRIRLGPITDRSHVRGIGMAALLLIAAMPVVSLRAQVACHKEGTEKVCILPPMAPPPPPPKNPPPTPPFNNTGVCVVDSHGNTTCSSGFHPADCLNFLDSLSGDNIFCYEVLLPFDFTTMSPPVFNSLAQPSLVSFSFERSLLLGNIQSTAGLALDPAVLGRLRDGSLELRERLVYERQTGRLDSVMFVVPTGVPFPTPAVIDLSASSIAAYTVQIYLVNMAAAPSNAIMLTGTVIQSSVTPFGSFLGFPASLSAGFTTDTPARILNVAEHVGGLMAAYSPSATGTLLLTQPAGPTPPDGGGANAPKVVITPLSQIVALPFVRLDASKSTDPNGLPLAFQWRVVSGTPSATIVNPNSATPDVQLNVGFNNYVFEVRVSDSGGNFATGRTTVQCNCR